MSKYSKRFIIARVTAACGFALLAMAVVTPLSAQVPEPIYDEADVPEYDLPDPLVALDGSNIKTAQEWQNERQPEILEIFAQQMYGVAPPAPESTKHKLVQRHTDALGGKAVMEEYDVTLAAGKEPLVMRMLVFRPKDETDAPAFLGLNFAGNHTVHSDPCITLNTNWMRNREDRGIKNNRASEASRGTSSSRWPVEMIIDRGFAVATIYYGDIDPDFDDGFENGVHGRFRSDSQPLAADQWGSIAAWAWGLSRALDALEDHPEIDAHRVAVIGHSRLGKTSLWAGASDPRFALVISNNSGCGGAALNRRRFGESVTRINTSFPHWFCDNFLKYNHNEDELPVDQHMLIAAIAPRPVYVASAIEDQWADPHGEFLSAKLADPVYRLLGTDGMGGDAPPQSFPEVDEPINAGTIGYHVRSGKHDVTEFDWKQYLDFASRHLKSDQ